MNITAQYLETLGPQITERDRAIIQTVSRFKLATGKQLERLYFADCAETSRARGRQAVLDRLIGHHVIMHVGHDHKETGQRRSMGGVGGGSRGYVYALDVAGQHLAGTSDSRPRRPLTWYEPAMAHLLAVTELYVRLVEAERAGALKLASFEAEPACWRPFDGRTLKPDAYVELDTQRDGNLRRRRFFIEVDRANQYGTKISNKLPQYLSYHQHERLRYQADGEGGQPFPGILFLAPTAERVQFLERLVQRDPMAARLFRVALFGEVTTVLSR